MKTIELTKGKIAIVDDENYADLNKFSWCYLNRGRYAVRMDKEKRKLVFMHRMIMNTPDGLVTDHINGNALDNRKENLRICTQAQNLANSIKGKRGSSSKYKGVSLFKRTGKWTAYICPDGKKIHLGFFDSQEKAAEQYNIEALKLFGDFAKLNVTS